MTLFAVLFFYSKSLLAQSPLEYLNDFGGVVVPAINIDVLPYKNTDTQVAPSLVIMGNINKLFIEGNRLGYMVNRSDFGALSVVGQIRAHQYTPEDSEFGQRDKALELGFQLAKPLNQQYIVQASAFADVSGTHKGQEFELSLFRRDFWGDFRLLTLLALQQQSQELTGYYADTVNYQADADTNAEIELIGVYEFSERFNVTAVYRHYIHGDGLANSPLTDSRHTQRLVLGVGWSF